MKKYFPSGIFRKNTNVPPRGFILAGLLSSASASEKEDALGD